MKPRKMQPRVMWAVVNQHNAVWCICESRSAARLTRGVFGKGVLRVVRVRVTEAP